MSRHKPIQFRAVHTKTRWRRASHETLANALGKKRGARALFDFTNKSIDYAKHGEPLYVFVWDEKAIQGEIVKPDHNQWDGLRHATISIKDISRFEKDGPPSNEELEACFNQITPNTLPGHHDANNLPESALFKSTAETLSELELELQTRIAESRMLTEAERLKRIELCDPMPRKIEVRVSTFIRNHDVIVQVLERAKGQCDGCGESAPFIRASDGSPYLEVHHVVPLSQGGSDTVGNARALCPNCHREEHYG